ncbi:MAG: Na(+)-translocating NADH-quinone reductase subunit C [Planctomycetota bacterium]|nr:Na(+)-translocating NADH-quinone reductase subunit C [Planctomycetota bacterium]
MPPKDSIANTFLVSFVLCVVCSLLVSSAAVVLKPLQQKNKELDQRRNVLAAAGLTVDRSGEEVAAADMSGAEVEEVFDTRVTRRLLDIETGEYVADGEADAQFDPKKAAKTPELNTPVTGEFKIGPSNREKQTWVYLIKDGESVEQFVIPIYGMGLWSTLYGFVAVDKDLATIRGLTYYEHGETPGLGGEVENPLWKSKWVGKKIYDEAVTVADATNDDIKTGVAKGAPTAELAAYQVDGISGATITCNGVTAMLKYWFSDQGFGPYFKKLASEQGAG